MIVSAASSTNTIMPPDLRGRIFGTHRVVQQTQLPEVDLHLHPRVAVGHPHRLTGAAEPAALHAEAVQRGVGHDHTPPLQ